MKSKFMVDFSMGIGSNSVKYISLKVKVDHQVYLYIYLSSYFQQAMKLYEPRYYYKNYAILAFKEL